MAAQAAQQKVEADALAQVIAVQGEARVQQEALRSEASARSQQADVNVCAKEQALHAEQERRELAAENEQL